ncbi:MAG: P-II family nitrogen regulator [Desulfobulbaceae bacterium]|nr:P-II family nitrogen regulator [Desulfobulbaceae bacterium]
MKEIKAFIKERKVDDVVFALSKIPELTGLSISSSKGFGRGRGKTRGEKMTVFDDRLFDVPGVKLEVMCQDELVNTVIDTIVKHAHTGLRSDGKIYVTHIETAVRISSGERGEAAV